jgi:hypothetical protein
MAQLSEQVSRFIHTSQDASDLDRLWHPDSLFKSGPNEITIFHPAAFDLLDGFSNETTKDVWYDIITPLSSLIFTRDNGVHKEGRKVWAQGLSVKGE